MMQIKGTITRTGLPKLLGAIWNLDIHDPPSLEKLKTWFHFFMGSRNGVIPLANESKLTIKRSSFKTLDKRRVRPMTYLVTGSLADDIIVRLLESGIEDTWESLDGDELGSLLSLDIRESEAPHVSVYPSQPPPSRRE
jgi:hypothetical protein